MGNSNHSHKKKGKNESKNGQQTKDIQIKHKYTKYGRSLSTELDQKPIQSDQKDGQTEFTQVADGSQTKPLVGQPGYPMTERITAFSSPVKINSAEVRSASVQNVLSAGMSQSSSISKGFQGNYGEFQKTSEIKNNRRKSHQRNRQENNYGELIKALDFVTSFSEFHHGEISGLNEIQGCLGLCVQEPQEEQQQIQSKLQSSRVNNIDKQPSLYSQFQSKQQVSASMRSLNGAQESKQPSVIQQQQSQQKQQGMGSNLKLNYNYFYNNNNKIILQEDIFHKNPFSSKEITEDSSFERELAGQTVVDSDQKIQSSSIKSFKEQPTKQQEEQEGEINYSQYWKELQKEAAESQPAQAINNNSLQQVGQNSSNSTVKLLKLSQLRLINQANVQANNKKLNELKVQQKEEDKDNQFIQNNPEPQVLSLLDYNRILAAKNKEESRITHSPSERNEKSNVDSSFKSPETYFDSSMQKQQPVQFYRQQTFGRQRSHSETLVKSISSRDFTMDNNQLNKDNKIQREEGIIELELKDNPMVSGKFGFNSMTKMDNIRQISPRNASGISKSTQKEGILKHDLEMIKAEDEQKESQEIQQQDNETQTNVSLRYASHFLFLEKLHRSRQDSKYKDDVGNSAKSGIQDEIEENNKQQWNGLYFDPMRIGSCRDRSYSEMIGKLKKQYAQQSKWLYASVINNVKQENEGRRSNKSGRSNSQKKLDRKQSEMEVLSQKPLLLSQVSKQQQTMMQKNNNNNNNNIKDKEKSYSQMYIKANSNNSFKVLKQSSQGIKRITPGNVVYQKEYQKGSKDIQYDFQMQQKHSNNFDKNKDQKGNQGQINKDGQVKMNNVILTRSQQAYLPGNTHQKMDQNNEFEEKIKRDNSNSSSSKSADSFDDSKDNESLDPIQISLAVSQFRKASMLKKDN